jgi:N4-bis(aminopropyl)spermidine synthase
MHKIDLYEAINAISAVVINRPKALREMDQIYMKFGDMLLQAEAASKWLNDKSVVFIGDGDAIGLCMMHLKKQKILDSGPSSILILDFDERVINSIKNFVNKNNLKKEVFATLYNVKDPLPKEIWGKYDAFYTNPPFGSNNKGESLLAFIRRGIEATNANAYGCIVAADYSELKWTQDNLFIIQKMLTREGFIISSLRPKCHQYHLDDNPNLTSCNIYVTRIITRDKKYSSKRLSKPSIKNFYGKNRPLIYSQIKDLTNGGKLRSRDYEILKLKGA